MAASATFALKAGVWFRRGRLLIASPDSLGTACPLSGRNSTYRPVQILEAGSEIAVVAGKTRRRCGSIGRIRDPNPHHWFQAGRLWRFICARVAGRVEKRAPTPAF